MADLSFCRVRSQTGAASQPYKAFLQDGSPEKGSLLVVCVLEPSDLADGFDNCIHSISNGFAQHGVPCIKVGPQVTTMDNDLYPRVRVIPYMLPHPFACRP